MLLKNAGNCSASETSKRKPFQLMLVGMFVAMAVIAGAARADTVTDWNAIMEATMTAPPSNPVFQNRWGAIVQLAVFEAVNSITGDYEPYLGTIDAPADAS